jgi:NADPH2:quinone reductase
MGSDPTAIISNDIAGIVWKVGFEVTSFEIGDHVFSQSKIGLDSGGLQQFVLLEADFTGLVPKGISDDEAATLPICGITAFVALFQPTGLGFPTPFPDNEGGSPPNCGNLSLVIIGGGANTGRMAVKFASLAGVSKIIVVATLSNAKLLRSYGATHIIDRYGSNEVIKAQIHEVIGDEVMFVLDVINTNHTLAVFLLSSTKRGRAVTLLRGSHDEAKIGEKGAGYEVVKIIGESHFLGEFGCRFWKEFQLLIERGKIKPLSFRIVEGGLNVIGVNKVLDDYRDGKDPGKWVVHPNF